MSSSYYQTQHWRALRAECKALNDRQNGGLCNAPGCQHRGTVCDHIHTRPNAPCPTAADVLSNLRMLCASHDAQVKEQHGRRGQGGQFKIRGCDEDGWPFDPSRR